MEKYVEDIREHKHGHAVQIVWILTTVRFAQFYFQIK